MVFTCDSTGRNDFWGIYSTCCSEKWQDCTRLSLMQVLFHSHYNSWNLSQISLNIYFLHTRLIFKILPAAAHFSSSVSLLQRLIYCLYCKRIFHGNQIWKFPLFENSCWFLWHSYLDNWLPWFHVCMYDHMLLTHNCFEWVKHLRIWAWWNIKLSRALDSALIVPGWINLNEYKVEIFALS